LRSPAAPLRASRAVGRESAPKKKRVAETPKSAEIRDVVKS